VAEKLKEFLKGKVKRRGKRIVEEDEEKGGTKRMAPEFDRKV